MLRERCCGVALMVTRTNGDYNEGSGGGWCGGGSSWRCEILKTVIMTNNA